MKRLIALLVLFTPSLLFAQSVVVKGTGTVRGTGILNVIPESGGASLVLGWNELPNTAIQPNGPEGAGDKAPANNFGGSGYAFADKVKGAVWAWNGAALDSTNKMLVMCANGGHSDYAGNECYLVDLSAAPATIKRATNPTVPIAGSCVEAISGRPNSRHTYNGLSFITTTGELALTGGSLACSNGDEGQDTWTLLMSSVTGSCALTSSCTPTWTNRGAPPNSCALNGKKQIYDSVRDLVWMDDRCNNFFSYSPSTHAWTRVANAPDIPANTNAAYDPDHEVELLMGNGYMATRSTASGSSYGVTTRSHASCNTPKNAGSIGVGWDADSHRFVAFTGSGRTVWVIDPVTWTCAAEDLGGTTPPTATAGSADGTMTFGRWQYVSSGPYAKTWVYYANYNANAYVYNRISATGERSFPSRCADAAVVFCQGLQTTGEIDPYISAGNTTPALNTAVHTSSTAGSLRFTVPATGTAGSAGFWHRTFADFGENSTLYWTYRWRADPFFVSTNYGSDGWKMHILWSNVGGSCSDVQFVTLNEYYGGYPRAYRSCGTPELSITMSDGDIAQQFGSGGAHGPDPSFTQNGTAPSAGANGYLCTYRKDDAGENNCAMYQGNNWMTFYYKFTIGNWNTANSRVEAWVAYEGQPMKKWMDLDQVNWPNDNPGAKKFRALDLLPYDTGRNSTVAQDANVYYSEVIISTQPILPPTGAQP